MEIRPLKIHFCKEEREEILNGIEEILDYGKLSQGENVRLFEEELERYSGMKHAIAVNSGSSAIEIVMRILGVQGKTVLVPTNTFLATATGVMFAGGKVKLVDTDPKTFSVSLDDLKKSYTDDTAGVIIVHIGGIITPEIDAIKEWCDEKNIWLFEDAAHAHGSTLNGKQAGTFGIAASYSLFATKVITCGEGGYVLCNDDNLAGKIRLFRNHGKRESWVTLHDSIGANYRMDEIHAVIARNQLRKLDSIIEERNKIAEFYTKYLEENLPEVSVIRPVNGVSNWYKYIVVLPNAVDRELLKSQLKEKGVNLQGEVYVTPLHKQPIAEKLGWASNKLPNAERLCAQHVCLPIYGALSKEELMYIVEVFTKTVKEQIKRGC